jgi:hypothetical protein
MHVVTKCSVALCMVDPLPHHLPHRSRRPPMGPVSCCVSCDCVAVANASAPTPCGNDSWFCPAAASLPTSVGPGFFSDGVPGFRSSRAPCPEGHYCNGSGVATPCPRGRFGGVTGLTDALCSGVCSDGVLCEAGSKNANGIPCPAGFHCSAGLSTPCPGGTYNPDQGGSAALVCIPCPAGYYSRDEGASSFGSCRPCDAFEGSHPGAVMCWPGLRGPSWFCEAR